MKPAKPSARLKGAMEEATQAAREGAHRPADWHVFSPIRAFTHCLNQGCNLAFALDLSGSFGRDEGVPPDCPYRADTRRTWQWSTGPSVLEATIVDEF